MALIVIGSIPACTGETSTGVPTSKLETVYPRVYGGNLELTIELTQVEGLSPRVRGKQMGKFLNGNLVRSIPACTGETRRRIHGPAYARVYPRVYGGNTNEVKRMVETEGLSPRVRGKHVPTQL